MCKCASASAQVTPRTHLEPPDMVRDEMSAATRVSSASETSRLNAVRFDDIDYRSGGDLDGYHRMPSPQCDSQCDSESASQCPSQCASLVHFPDPSQSSFQTPPVPSRSQSRSQTPPSLLPSPHPSPQPGRNATPVSVSEPVCVPNPLVASLTSTCTPDTEPTRSPSHTTSLQTRGSIDGRSRWLCM
jgi:hypothetical protein